VELSGPRAPEGWKKVKTIPDGGVRMKEGKGSALGELADQVWRPERAGGKQLTDLLLISI